MIAAVGDVDLAGGIHDHASGQVKLRTLGRAAVTCESRRAGTRHRGDCKLLSPGARPEQYGERKPDERMPDCHV